MDKLKMTSKGTVAGNVEKIAALFPNCVTEVATRVESPDGTVRYESQQVIDFDKLRQELSAEMVEGDAERYQFTWPDKRAANHLANQPTTMTLRPCEEESVGKDGTNGVFDSENLYIEGDNLDVLKVLRETYLGKVKMIYIDPPYNTGNDFVYNDDFASSYEEFASKSKAYDENGNLMFNPKANGENNGRFHTDWLNMIYPRLKVARDLLSDDGAIFISIDDNEVENLKKVCNEIFGKSYYAATFPWRKRTAKSDVPFGISQDYEWIVVYCKSNDFVGSLEGNGRKYYETSDFPQKPWRVHDMTTQRTALERPNSNFTIVNPKNGEEYPVNPQAVWRITKDGFPEYIKENRIVFPGDYDFLRITKPVLRYWKEDDIKKDGNSFGRIAVTTKLDDSIGMSQDGTKEITSIFEGKAFSYPKPSSLIKSFIKIINDKDYIVLDFFSGSATTAHAVMKLNAEDGGKRKFIMVQMPEVTDEKSEARKAGYNTICEIGKERIRRAGKKIKEEAGLQGQDLDIGFRVLKLAESNMQDVFYAPDKFEARDLFTMADNVKSDRTGEDLLFQVMLELGIELSSTIEKKTINGIEVFNVKDGFLIATFDKNVNESTIAEIAKNEPVYFVMRDASAVNDNVLDNFDQLFRHYSPDTIRKIL